MKDVSESIGETERTTQRLMKLNNLIPEIQSLVSSGILGVTATGPMVLIKDIAESMGESERTTKRLIKYNGNKR